MLRFIYAAVLAISLSGCSILQSKPEVQIKTVKEYVFVDVPSEYYTLHEIPKPPTKEQYMTLSDSGKEYTLVMYSNELLAALAQYRILQESLRKWNESQRAIYRQSAESIPK